VLFMFGVLASAQSKTERDEAQRLYKQADTDYKLQNYQEALTNFQRSYELSKEPAILFNIGQCYRQLKQPLDAKKTFQSFLRDAPNHPKRKSAEELIIALEEELARLATKGAIDISCKQDPVEIFLDGASKGMSPQLLKQIEPGNHKLILKKQGFSDARMTVAVKPSETSTLKDLQLAPLTEQIEISRIPEKKFLLASAGLLGGGILTTSAGAFFSAKARSLQDDGLAAQDPAQLDEQIARADTPALVLGIATAGLLTAAVVVAGAGVKAKINQNKTSQAEQTP
jgi:tetratricopeptide (TPR) repeat protein